MFKYMSFLLRNLVLEDNLKTQYFVDLTGFSSFFWIRLNVNSDKQSSAFLDLLWGAGRAKTCKFVKAIRFTFLKRIEIRTDKKIQYSI